MESRATETTNKPEAAKSAWVAYTDPTSKAKVVINRDLFDQFGIVVLAANSGYRAPVSGNRITIEDRELRFGKVTFNNGNPVIPPNKKSTVQQSPESDTQLAEFNPEGRFLRRVMGLRNALNAYSSAIDVSSSTTPHTPPQEMQVIYNANRREEVFVPIGRDVPTYANLSLSSSSSTDSLTEFAGLKYFVTAGCMFGSSLKGRDQRGGTYPLIKHFFETYETQVFDELNLDGHFPYEDDLLRKDKALAKFAKQFGKRDADTKPTVMYHLPYYDYILFAAQLFIHGQTTLEVFGLFCVYILEKKHELSQKIKQIYGKYDVEVNIESPFENLFEAGFADMLIERFKLNGEHEVANMYEHDTLSREIVIAKLFLKELDLADLIDEKNQTGKSVSTVQTEEQKRIREKDFVQSCIAKLSRENSNKPTQAQVWRDFLALGIKPKPTKKAVDATTSASTMSEAPGPINSIKRASELESIEELFTVANPVLIGQASLTAGTTNKKTTEICSFLPMSEKPIQIGYADFAKRNSSQFPQKSNSYGTVLNITTMETCLSFSPKNKGLIFYNVLDPTCLAALTSKGLLKAAQRNRSLASSSHGFFHTNSKPKMSIDDVIKASPSQPSKTPLQTDIKLGSGM